MSLARRFTVRSPSFRSRVSHGSSPPLPQFSHTHLRSSLELDRLARLAGALGVGRDVGVELLLLLRDLGGVVLAALRLVDLQAQHLELELEDLVLDLADLQGVGGRAGRRLEGLVEAARVRLGGLGRLLRRLDDRQIGGIDAGQVGLVNLRGECEYRSRVGYVRVRVCG